jgi:acyl-coenzyme A thioesterase PaaI-like protein
MMNCHGGMLMAFADTAFGHAVSMRKSNHYWVTVRLLSDFISAARLGDWVEGSARVIGQDDDLFTVDGRIWCGDRTIMTGTGIFKILGARPERR